MPLSKNEKGFKSCKTLLIQISKHINGVNLNFQMLVKQNEIVFTMVRFRFNLLLDFCGANFIFEYVSFS